VSDFLFPGIPLTVYPAAPFKSPLTGLAKCEEPGTGREGVGGGEAFGCSDKSAKH